MLRPAISAITRSSEILKILGKCFLIAHSRMELVSLISLTFAFGI